MLLCVLLVLGALLGLANRGGSRRSERSRCRVEDKGFRIRVQSHIADCARKSKQE